MAAGPERNVPVDWEAVERSPEFQALVTRRRAFVLPATVFFLSWYLVFILLAGYAPGFMGERIHEGLTVGYVLALTQFVMVGVLGRMYLRRSERVYDPLSARVVERALEQQRSGRFERGDATATATATTTTSTEVTR